MKFFIVLVSVIATVSLQAQDLRVEDLSLPDGLEAMSDGYPVAPIVQCPRPAKKYMDMLAQLDTLKNRIQSEACRNSGEINAIENGVTDLQSLVTDKRKAFLNLVKKGTSSGQQLSSTEVQDLENYIDQVVKKASVVTGFLDNKACFDKKTKFFTLGTLSSVIGEVSGAVGAIAGPFGAQISLAGGVVAGLLKSMNTIVTARTSYDTSVEEDRVNYLNTLCAYNDFKTDFDKETKTLAYDRRLRKARNSAANLLNVLSEKCPECAAAIQDFESRFNQSLDFVVERGAGVSTFTQNVKASELGPNDLMNRYFLDDYSEASSSENKNPKPQPSVPSNVSMADQQATVTALLTKAWAETEREKLMESEGLGESDELRQPIVDRQNAIEEVLFVSVAPDYVKYQRKQLESEFAGLNRMASAIATQLETFYPQPDPNNPSKLYNSSLEKVMDEVFREDLKFKTPLNPVVKYTDKLMYDFVELSSERIMNQFDNLRRQYSLLEQRCAFFTNSLYDIKKSSSLYYACERSKQALSKVSQAMKKIEATSFGKEFPHYLKTFRSSKSNWSSDWLESVTDYLNTEAKKRD